MAWTCMDICFFNIFGLAFWKLGASYGMYISKPYFFVGAHPPKKIGASYGIEISKHFFFVGAHPKK